MAEISNAKVFTPIELENSTSEGRVQIWKLPAKENSREPPKWERDRCGMVTAQYTKYDNIDPQSSALLLVVHSEDDGRLILKESVSNETTYELQGEENAKTMIVWYANGLGYCLSFQEVQDCQSVWQKILNIQAEKKLNGGDDDFDEIEDLSICDQLPPCELSKLDEIQKFIEQIASLQNEEKKTQYADMIERELYIPQLIDLFRMCEDLDNTEGLYSLFGIFKSLFNLEKLALLTAMFQPENIMDTVGILEYDPDKKERTPHRDYLNKKAHFNEVIPISNEELLHKIHQTYRAQYIKDILVPIPSLFDEGMSTLSSFIYFNKLEICSLIKDDTHFLEAMFERLTDDEISDDKRKDVILLLKELCAYSQSMQANNRDMFMKTLANHGLLQTIDQLMNIEDAKMRSAIVDIIVNIVEFSPSLLRMYLCKEVDPLDEDSMLLNTLIDILLSSDDKGQGVVLVQLIKNLLDTGNMDLGENKTEKSEFLSFFYRHCMHTLTAPLLAATATDILSGKDDFKRATVMDYIVDILTFCVEQRHFTIRNYIVSKDMLRRVLVLMQSKHKFLALAALRFCRKILSLKDDVFNRCIIVGKLIKPIVEAFVKNGKKYNLLNSAILELFEFIKSCKDDLKFYVAKNHLGDFRDVSYVNTFMEIEKSYEQYKDGVENRAEVEPTPSVGIIHSFSSKKPDEWAMDKDEECWFDSEEDEFTDITHSIEPEDIDKNDFNLFENLQPASRTETTFENGPVHSDGNKETQNYKDSESSLNNVQRRSTEMRNTLKPLPSELSSLNRNTMLNKIWNNKPRDNKLNAKTIKQPFIPIKINSTNLSLKNAAEQVQNGVTSHSPKNNGVSADHNESVHVGAQNKPVLTSLVDYPDDDDEDEDDDADVKKTNDVVISAPAKKQRLSST